MTATRLLATSRATAAPSAVCLIVLSTSTMFLVTSWEAVAVSAIPRDTFSTFAETRATFLASSLAVTLCSSTAEAIVRDASFTLPIELRDLGNRLDRLTDGCLDALDPLANVVVAPAVCLASSFTSVATTANPFPASPARAASIVAFKASRLVCSAISSITWMTLPISVAACPSVVMSPLLAAATSEVRTTSEETFSALLAISLMLRVICSMASAMPLTLALASSVALDMAVIVVEICSDAAAMTPARLADRLDAYRQLRGHR